MTVDDLIAIEEIRNLRYGYAAHYDAQDIDALADVFTDDAVCDFGADYGGIWQGREVIRRNYEHWIRETGEPFDSLHVVTNPWIRIAGPDMAWGRWYLLDLLTRQYAGSALATRGGESNPLLWLAIYEDDYRREHGCWKIAYCKLSFLWPRRSYDGLRHRCGEP